MRYIFKNLLYGLLVIVLVTLCELVITLPFGSPWDIYEPFEISDEVYRHYLNIEFLLTAIPAGIVIFFILKFSKSSCTSAIKKGFLWTSMLCFNYIFIGMGNNNFTIIFSTFGIYILLLCSLLGTLFYIKLKAIVNE